MSVKLNGSEWMRFYSDRRVWTKGTYHDDDIILVNGKNCYEHDIPLDIVDNDAEIVVRCGSIYKDGNLDFREDMIDVIKMWREAQDYRTVLVKVPSDKYETFRKQVTDAGWEIV